MIQSRSTQEDDLLFAQDPTDTVVDEPASNRAKQPGGGLNRIKPKTGKAAEKRRRRLENIRRNILAEKEEEAARETTVAATIAAPSPRFSPSDFEAKPQRKSGNPRRKPKQPERNTETSAALAAFAAFDVATDATKKSPRAKPKVRSKSEPEVHEWNLENSDVAGNYQVIDPPPPEPETYREWFKRVVANHRWTTWFTTFYIHWLLLLLLAAIIVHGPDDTARLLISATFAETVEEEIPTFDVISPEPMPEPESEPETVPETEPEVVEMEEEEVELSPDIVSELATEPPPEASTAKSASTSESAAQATAASAIAAFNPAPPSAVNEGSFSVWTEPTSPVAGEPYRIIIQVRLPESIKRYDLSDLQGVVVGSDGYRKPIPGTMQGALPIDNGYARFVVPIVSADVTVRDTVFIRSRLLKETQKLVLQF